MEIILNGGSCLVWDKIAANFADTDYVFGKIDATVNEIDGFPKINSFPTIKLFMKDGRQVYYRSFQKRKNSQFSTLKT